MPSSPENSSGNECPPNPVNPNRTRDHLANERTYLAWIRTALALMGFGVVIVRLRYLMPPEMRGHTHGWELGILLALCGLVLVVVSAFQYLQVQRAIERDNYEPAGRWIILCSVVIGVLGLGILYYLMASPPAAVTAPHARLLH